MKCRKCEKEIKDDSVYCSYCAEPQREKCQECGELELIGRKVCESKYKEATETLDSFLYEKVGKWREHITICLAVFVVEAVIISALLIFSRYQLAWMIPVIIITTLLGTGIVMTGYRLQNKAEKDARDKFMQQFGKYADIILKVENQEKGYINTFVRGPKSPDQTS